MPATPEAYGEYIDARFGPEDDVLVAVRAKCEAENLPAIQVGGAAGRLLQILTVISGAKRVLEIGTLGGYSGICFLRGMGAGGKLITLEIDPHHADVANANFTAAGFADQVEIQVAPASETLSGLDPNDPFDIVFIDANKDGYPAYLDQSLPLLRPGGLLIADNTLREAVLDPNTDDPIAEFNQKVASHPNLTAGLIPIFKWGIDGIVVALKS